MRASTPRASACLDAAGWAPAEEFVLGAGRVRSAEPLRSSKFIF